MKRLFAFFIASILILCTACSANNNNSENTDSGTTDKITLKVWGSQEDQKILKSMIDEFKKNNNYNNIDITFGVVSEADAKTEMLKDVAAGADVFAFASDQIAELHKAGALYRISKDKDKIIAENTEASIKACTINGEMYAFPSSSDTYFMYYDKSKYSEDEVKSLEKMLAKDLGKNVKNFAFNVDDGWYNSGFFFANGCTLFGEDGLDPKKCDFNSQKGVEVGNYLLDLVKNPKFASFQDDGQLLANVKNKTYAAFVSGTWNAAAVKEYLGENYAATKLPTININGKDIQLSSMANFKLYGVNSQTKHPIEALALAQFLTNEENQKIRFEKRDYAPTNKKLASNEEALKNNIAVSALANQAQYSTLQASIPQVNNFWPTAEAFGKGLLDGTVTKANMQQKLDALVKGTLEKIS